jgi:taurine dioxygenase
MDQPSSPYRLIDVTPEAHGFGAAVNGVDLAGDLTAEAVAEIRDAWTRHSVIFFPRQLMDVDDLERFSLRIGPFGHDPYIAPMAGHANVLEVRREADETSSVFGAAWHSDWSFQATPPAATILHGEVIPPVGGDTLYADGYRAWEALSDAMRATLAPLRAVHSARRAYGLSSPYAKETDRRGMRFLVSPEAEESVSHPLVRNHPVSGRRSLFVNPVYTVGIEGMTGAEGDAILKFLFAHMTSDEFVYRHRWARRMLTMWDNRCTMHTAQGGYDGHLRVLHRTTVAGETPS